MELSHIMFKWQKREVRQKYYFTTLNVIEDILREMKLNFLLLPACCYVHICPTTCMSYMIKEYVTLVYSRAGSQETVLETATGVSDQPAVIPAQDSLIGDLLSMDISAPTVPVPAATSVFSPPPVDLLGGGLDSLVGFVLIFLTL